MYLYSYHLGVILGSIGFKASQYAQLSFDITVHFKIPTLFFYLCLELTLSMTNIG